MISPCKDCLDREAECHSNCSKYDEWKEYMSGIQEIKNKENALRADFRARSYERYIKAKKRSYPRKREEY